MDLELGLYLSLSLALLLSLLSSKLVKKLKLPNVTGYIIFGLIAGPSIFNIFSKETISSFAIIPEIALGFIAFSIGSEFKISYLKKMGKSSIVIAFFESTFAVILIDIVLLIVGVPASLALVLGSIAAATAPAATLMIVRQYKAKGPVTNTLLPVVAIDDAFAIMIFGVSTAIVNGFFIGGAISISSIIIDLIIEIFGSIIFGLILGIIMSFLTKWFTGRGNRLSIAIIFIFIAIGVSNIANFSALLVCMSLSAVYANISRVSEKVFELVERFTPPLYILFFFISGAELDLGILPSVGMIGVIYIVVRVIGKVIGAGFGAHITKSEPVVKKYLGWTLIPQAGVAIGLISAAMNTVPEHGDVIRAVVLSSVVIYELVGPLLTKSALKKAGEIKKKKDVHELTPDINKT